MFLEIITPDKKVFEGEVSAAQFPGTDGFFEVLNNHAPMISALKAGQLKVTSASGVQFFNLDSGVVEVLNNRVIVLAEAVLS